MRKYLIGMILFCSLYGCGSTTKSDKNENDEINSSKNSAKTVYNQAYQENFDADSMEYIVKNAKGSYVLVDVFLENVIENIEKIKENNNEVAGYISAGTAENYRDDFNDLEPFIVSKAWSEWSNEFFINDTNSALKIMKKRIDKMAKLGLDWVEFDNMDWVDDENREKYNLSVTDDEGMEYIQALCTYTHEKNMKCMAKNTVDGFENFDGVLYESYDNEKNWWDNEGTKLFLKEEKLVIINHYNEKNCDEVFQEYKEFYKTQSLSFICEDMNLKRYRHY